MEAILEEMTLPELFALHTKLKADIKEIRKTCALIDAEIHRKEVAAQAPGNPALAQTIGGVTVYDLTQEK